MNWQTFLRTIGRSFKQYWTVVVGFSVVITVVAAFGLGGYLSNLGLLGMLGACAIALVLTISFNLLPRHTTVTVAQFDHILIYLPLYLADHFGFFRRERLKVKFISTGGDKETWDKVHSTEAQFGVGDPIVMMDDNGNDGVVISSLVASSPIRGITKGDMAPIRSAENLKNVPLYVFSKKTTTYKMLQYFLGISGNRDALDDVVEISVNSESSYLDATPPGVVFTYEPRATEEIQNGAREVISFSDTYGEFLNTGVFVTKAYAKNNAETMQRFVNAIERSLIFFYEDKPKSLGYALKNFTGFSEEAVYRAMARITALHMIAKHTPVEERLWRKALKVRYGDESIGKVFNNHVDNSFATSAKAYWEKIKRRK